MPAETDVEFLLAYTLETTLTIVQVFHSARDFILVLLGPSAYLPRCEIHRVWERENLRRKAVITVMLNTDALEMKDEELEGAIKFYLKAEDIPFCERVEKVQVLSEGYLNADQA